MTRLLDALLRLDTVARVGARVLGPSSHQGRALHQAVEDVRRLVAPVALHEAAERFDPKTDLKQILAAASAAGLEWPDMVEALNTFHHQNLGA